MSLRALVVALSVIAAASMAAGEALARTDAEKQAQVLFDEAMRLMGQKRVAEACPKLAASQALDPGMGTQFRLAECYEKIGKVATAYELFHAVAESARAAKLADRASVAERRAAAIEPRIPRLTVDVPADVAAIPGLEVRLDGGLLDRRLWGAPQPVDAGDHLVEVQAPGRKPWSGKAALEGAARLSIPVPVLEVVAAPRDEPPPRSITPAIVLGIVGATGVAIGATFVGLRAARSSAATSIHDDLAARGGRCTGGGAGTAFADRCADLADATSRGDTYGTVAIASFVVGGAAIAGMVGWLALSPRGAQRSAEARLLVVPTVGLEGGGLLAAGAF